VSEGAQKKQEKARKFQAIRGTRDLLPPDTDLWNHVDQTARQVFSSFGYGEIRPPIFEATELFARGVGSDTDIVGKEMYTFEDHDFVELERLRTLILGLEFQLNEVGNFGTFLVHLETFTEGLRQAMEKNAIPMTLGNILAQKDLENYLSSFKKVAVGQATESVLGDPNFDTDFALVQQALNRVRFGDVISLRPEATASVCRAYIEHNMQQWPQPVKLYYIGPMFRRERPQKGRYRQFYQIGAEVLEKVASGGQEVASGEWRVASEKAKDEASAAAARKELAKDAATDAEVIEMLMTFFERIGLRGTELSVNSIGHSAPPVEGKNVCRRAYVELLREELRKVKDQLGADSQRRIETNPLRVLDSKLEHEQAIIAKLPHIADHLCDECKMHYAELKRQLDLRGVAYKENWRLVRGLDYYMRTTFEITARGLGSQDSVCGGGRYDGLVELLGGPPTKGIGFAIGEDRVILSLQEQKEVASGERLVASLRTGLDVYVTWMGEAAYPTALRAAKTLRGAGFRVDMPAAELKFGKALERASKLNARFALILGDNEVRSGEWTLKKLADGSQQKLTEAALLEYLHR
jgi:histidyl-tRNA synthetase